MEAISLSNRSRTQHLDLTIQAFWMVISLTLNRFLSQFEDFARRLTNPGKTLGFRVNSLPI